MGAVEIKDLHRNPQSNVFPMLLNLAGVAVALVALAKGWPADNWFWIAAWVAWLAYFQHTWMTIFHEDVHYTLYRAKWHNIMNGTIVGTLLTVPFSVYRHVHIRHHNRMNHPEDWELWPYVDPTKSLAFRRWFMVFDLLLGLFAAPYIYSRIFFSKHSPLTEPKQRRRIWLEYGLIVVFWGSLWGIVIYTGAWWLFAKMYLIPAWLSGTVQTVRKFTEHLGLPLGTPMEGARTVLPADSLAKAVAYTSFHISAHGVHHQYPQMPHENLEKVVVFERAKHGDAPVFTSHVRAMQDMARHLWHPGIGVNARTTTGATSN
ncbi:MAG TPA: fatty acid desaturase [Phycisphaerae bacterium]|nr:fatty acid desaturase [Phycisphaerae bacterium]